MIGEIREAWAVFRRIWQLRHSPVWLAARNAVEEVRLHATLQAAASSEERTTFCPRCGQIPDGDRRMDEARHKAMLLLDGSVRRAELDAALGLHFWLRKNA